MHALRQIVRDTASYPSPVIALGSQHTVNQAMVNQGGTIVQLHAWNSILGLEERCCLSFAGLICLEQLLHPRMCMPLRQVAQGCAGNVPAVMLTMSHAARRRKDELLPGQGKKVVRLQPGVKMLQLARWLDGKGYECSFAPGVTPDSEPDQLLPEAAASFFCSLPCT